MRVLLPALLTLCGSFASAQGILQAKGTNLPDTVKTPEKYFLFYQDHSWSVCYSPDSYASDLQLTKTLPLFLENWKPEISAYSATPGVSMQVQDTLSIQLIDQNRSYSTPINPTKAEKARSSGFSGVSEGIIIPAQQTEKVFSVFDGKVRIAEFTGNPLGNLVIIRHFNGTETWYGNLSEILILPNQLVKAGQTIGKTGKTGQATSNQLFFSCRWKDRYVNPSRWMNASDYSLQSEQITLWPNQSTSPPLANAAPLLQPSINPITPSAAPNTIQAQPTVPAAHRVLCPQD